MSRAFTGGKRQREATRDRKKKDKEERLRHNRQLRAQGIDPDLTAAPEAFEEVKLEDVVISVAPQERRNSVGPVKLFVGGLSWGTSTEDLRNVFANFGTIDDVAVILDRATGRSRGFGFVTFSNAADAVEAVKQMNGAQLDGRTLKVNNAESR